MSKDFDTALSDALDSVASAARSAGPVAAQIRGRKRSMHKRIALSTVSLVLVAVGTTVAFKASNAGSAPHPVGANPSISVSSSPTTAAPTHSASSPASSSPASSSPTTSGSTSSSQSATSSQPTSADPHQVVDAAWLTSGQMPFAGTFFQWKVTEATSQGAPIGQQLTPTVFYVPNDTNFQVLTMCADPAKLLPRTIGAQHTEYTATKLGSVSDQFIFFFANDASAQQTYQWLQTQYSSACLSGSNGVQVTKTGGDGETSAAWLTTKGSTGPVDMSPYNREYFVLRGSTIAYVAIQSTAKLPTAWDDASQLSTIAAHLCVYGGSCN